MSRSAILSAALLAACGSSSAGPAPPDGATASWHVVLQGLPSTLLSVWGSSPSNVFTVGGPLGNGTPATILHYDGSAWKELAPEEEEAAVDRVAAVRAAVGPGVGLMIEFHGRLAAGAAVATIRRLERFDPAWCEEPVAPERVELRAEVRRQVRAPIAAGERLYTLADFHRLTSLRAADVVQMDIAHCGGLLAAKKVAAFAAVQDLRVAPHCSIGPVALAAALHFDVSTPNFMIQEAFAEFDVP